MAKPPTTTPSRATWTGLKPVSKFDERPLTIASCASVMPAVLTATVVVSAVETRARKLASSDCVVKLSLVTTKVPAKVTLLEISPASTSGAPASTRMTSPSAAASIAL